MENAPNLTEKILIDLVLAAEDVTKAWLDKAWHKKIDLGCQSPEQHLQIYGNPIMIKEMFNNLIDNAIKYTQEGGQITVEVRHASRPGILLIEVRDTGPGISDAEKPRVMERFYRILGSDVEGSGLGLAIVKEIAVQHGGKLEILDNVYQENPKKVGACMRVSLPVGRV
jgi:two-component system sensor histidine kinase TctE